MPSASEAVQPTRHLTEAIRALRIERSPTTALALLDRHAGELEGNALAREALTLRVEAMLELGRRKEILRLLDRAPLNDGAASRALLLVRGQLRAATNRCSEALADFDLVLAQARQPPKEALLGRALCRKKLGDHQGAKADLERYRREFPGDRAVDDQEKPGARR
jgi:tetratricopeptide (TPR) repeat protein